MARSVGGGQPATTNWPDRRAQAPPTGCPRGRRWPRRDTPRPLAPPLGGDVGDDGGTRVSIEPVNPQDLARPYGFSHAVTASGGRLVFLAGQTALDPSGTIVGADVATQFERALANLLKALRAAGGKPEHLASLTIYATDLADYRAHGRDLREVWQRLAG